MEPFAERGLFPVIFCRNVMIYFDKATQEARGRPAGGVPGAGRISVDRPCREPDAGSGTTSTYVTAGDLSASPARRPAGRRMDQSWS